MSEELEVERFPAPARQETRELAGPMGDSFSIQRIIESAIEKGTGVEALERIKALWDGEQDRRAAREFSAALADFQGHCPPVPKTSSAKITTKSGASFAYAYAELDEIARVVQPHLHSRGFSFAWDCDVNERILTAVCTLRHSNGHSVTAKFAAPIDASAAMSEPQKYASALTYAKRQSLIQVLGITTADPDTDIVTGDKITPDQKDNLRTMMQETRSNVDAFMKFMGVNAIDDILQSQYPRAVAALEQKRKTL